jgi:N-acetylglutamate synthase-like GNAT family acetyltransferase
MECNFQIEEFCPQHMAEIIDLIVKIQREEYGVNITAEEQPDLARIEEYYQVENGNFWVARYRGKVIGTVALLDIGRGIGALRKMFVAAQYRGKQYGVSKALLEVLLQWAREHQFHEIVLGTTAKFLAAHRFYQKNGFNRIEKSSLPSAFPLLEVDSLFFKKKIE